MSIYNPESSGGSGNSGGGGGQVIPTNKVLPDGYTFSKSVNGDLELLENGSKIAHQSKDGSWFKSSVSTGVGSLHLGGNDSGGIAHSVSSIGQNVGFKNEFSTANERDKFLFFPTWQGVTTSGDTVRQPSVIDFSDHEIFLSNGSMHPTNIVGYNYTTTASLFNSATFEVTFIPNETYTGNIRHSLVAIGTGVEVYSITVPVSCVSGTPVTLLYKYPFFTRTNDQVQSSMLKDNGQPIIVKAGTTNTSAPYIAVKLRRFINKPIVSLESNGKVLASQIPAPHGTEIVASLTALTGGDKLPASAIRDYPVMSTTVAGMAKLGPTMSIDGNGVLNTTVLATGIKIVANQAARLAVPVSGGAILVIQQDDSCTYGIEAGLDTSVLSNWKQIGTVATNVMSFNGRNGAVIPTKDDYNMEQIGLTDRANAKKYVFRVENGVPYIEEIL